MIIETKTGRRMSTLTKEEELRGLMKRIEGLSDSEWLWLRQIAEELQDIVSDGKDGFESLDELKKRSAIYLECAESHYEGEVVGVEEFCMEKHYLGHVGSYFYEKWKRDLVELFDGQYNEAIVTGSIGSGKTTFCDMGLSYMFYELCMLRNPQATFGLMPGSEIVLVCFNRDQRLARDVTFGGFKRKIEGSPFFKRLGIKFGTSELVYGKKNIRVIAISAKSADALGRDVFGGLIDETDFIDGSILKGGGLPKPGEKPFVEMLHESIKRRMVSRYDRAGVLPGKLLLSSSARHKKSFSNRRISESSTDPTIFCRDYAIYDVAPEDRFSKDRFWVLVGNERVNHEILSRSKYRSLGEVGRRRLEEQGCRFIRVPLNYKPDFERNLEDSIRDISGVVTVSVAPFFQVRSRLYEMVDPTLSSPVRVTEWCTGDVLEIDWRLLTKKYSRKIGPGEYVDELGPRRHPEAPRHVHIDLSLGLTDPAGMCIAHEVGKISLERRSSDGTTHTEDVPLIEADLILRIVAPPGGEIDFGAIRGIVYDFQRHGFNIAFASMDSFQSRDMLQQFAAKGIDGEVLSVDKTVDPYTCLKTTIYEGRLSSYNYPILTEELEQLERDETRGKIDHPANGSKDCADSICGVVYTLTTKQSYNAPVLSGISEYEGPEKKDEWIRRSMQHSGEVAPVEVKDDDSDIPLIFSG